MPQMCPAWMRLSQKISWTCWKMSPNGQTCRLSLHSSKTGMRFFEDWPNWRLTEDWPKIDQRLIKDDRHSDSKADVKGRSWPHWDKPEEDVKAKAVQEVWGHFGRHPLHAAQVWRDLLTMAISEACVDDHDAQTSLGNGLSWFCQIGHNRRRPRWLSVVGDFLHLNKMRELSWFFVGKIATLKALKVVWPIDNEWQTTFIAGVDATDESINEPCDPHVPKKTHLVFPQRRACCLELWSGAAFVPKQNCPCHTGCSCQHKWYQLDKGGAATQNPSWKAFDCQQDACHNRPGMMMSHLGPVWHGVAEEIQTKGQGQAREHWWWDLKIVVQWNKHFNTDQQKLSFVSMLSQSWHNARSRTQGHTVNLFLMSECETRTGTNWTLDQFCIQSSHQPCHMSYRWSRHWCQEATNSTMGCQAFCRSSCCSFCFCFVMGCIHALLPLPCVGWCICWIVS